MGASLSRFWLLHADSTGKKFEFDIEPLKKDPKKLELKWKLLLKGLKAIKGRLVLEEVEATAAPQVMADVLSRAVKHTTTLQKNKANLIQKRDRLEREAVQFQRYLEQLRREKEQELPNQLTFLANQLNLRKEKIRSLAGVTLTSSSTQSRSLNTQGSYEVEENASSQDNVANSNQPSPHMSSWNVESDSDHQEDEDVALPTTASTNFLLHLSQSEGEPSEEDDVDNPDSIYQAATQQVPIPALPTSRTTPHQSDNIYDADTDSEGDVYQAATLCVDLPPRSPGRPHSPIYDASTLNTSLPPPQPFSLENRSPKKTEPKPPKPSPRTATSSSSSLSVSSRSQTSKSPKGKRRRLQLYRNTQEDELAGLKVVERPPLGIGRPVRSLAPPGDGMRVLTPGFPLLALGLVLLLLFRTLLAAAGASFRTAGLLVATPLIDRVVAAWCFLRVIGIR
eukprot:m.167133 g.167133  ORF g.167133 m.167133 type:complete len:451 (-) comp25033_c1_seq11:47-1399(-)